MAISKRPLEESRGTSAGKDDGRQAKQQRMDPENFPKGTIIKIRCRDFMTYKEAVFKPSPRLNLILAPNGAGKSSLTCALCLGLAGDPKILGRADKAINFIRRGQQEAFTEVTLSSGPGKHPLVIQRRLTKDNLSKYRVNGVEKKRSDVIDLMTDLNVQLDNLCQFLPQDKVQSFAQMTPKQLLEESERALADGKYYQLHQELVQESMLLETSERVAEALERKLADEEKLLAEVQREKDRFDQRRGLEEQAELMEFRVAWLDANQARLKALEYQEKVANAKRNLNQKQLELQESQAPVKERIAAEQSQKRSVADIRAAVTEADNAMDAANTQCLDLVKRAQEKWDDIGGLKQQAEKQQQDVAKAEAALAKAQADLEGLPGLDESASQNPEDADTIKAELRDLAAQVADFEQQLAGLKGTYEDYSRDLQRHQEQAKRLDDGKNIKLRQLEQKSRGITDFTHWVEKSKADGMFRGKVLGPILLEVAVPDPQHAKYLEQQMPENIWSRFVTVFHEDQDLLRKAARERGYRALFSTNYTGNSTTPLQYPDGRPEEYSMHGVTYTLDQVFNAPLLIKKIMNDESGITRAFIGTENCDWKAIMAEGVKIRNLYTPESNYRKSQSQYNAAAKTKSVSAIREGLRYLGGAQDDREEREQLAQAIAEGKGATDAIRKEGEALDELKAKASRECGEKRTALRKLEYQAIERKNRKAKLEAAVKTKERMLQNTRNKPDPMQRATGLQRDIARLNNQTETAVKKVLAEFKKTWENHRELGCAAALHRETAAQVAALQEQHKGANEAVKHAEKVHADMQNLYSTERKTVKRKCEAAQALTGDLKKKPELKDALNALSDDIEELQADIERLHHEAAVVQCGNPRVLQEYEERTDKVRKLKEEFTNASSGLQTLTSAVEKKKASWLPEVQRMVQTVNHHFQRMLSGMGCNGQVSLYCGCPDFDGCNAFDKYAIHIRVKFRDEEELQLLTANRQSGGERAVCTILYIIALQHVTVTPFRVVDEINQGMDRINERKVFIQMVEAACRPGTPQCFMFTPKLLPDLPYTYDVMPMTIFNGLHNEELTEDFGDESFAKGMPVVYKGPIAA